jgi:hypothetical protein
MDSWEIQTGCHPRTNRALVGIEMQESGLGEPGFRFNGSDGTPSPFPEDGLCKLAHGSQGGRIGAEVIRTRESAGIVKEALCEDQVPARGSRTCCHGRVASGCRNRIGRSSFNARMQSGTILSGDQSPPPITFSALALAAPKLLHSAKKEEEYAAKMISAAAFEALYGSFPPSSSFSRYPQHHSWFL